MTATVRTVAAPAETPYPRIAELIEHWRGLAPGPGLLPGRRHFDPLSVPHLLPNLWLLEVGPPPPPRYRVRLMGSAMAEAGFAARAGDLLDDPRFMSDPAAIRCLLDRVVETGECDWRRGPPGVRHAKCVNMLERVVLPLAADGKTVDMLLGMTVFYWQDGSVRG